MYRQTRMGSSGRSLFRLFSPLSLPETWRPLCRPSSATSNRSSKSARCGQNIHLIRTPLLLVFRSLELSVAVFFGLLMVLRLYLLLILCSLKLNSPAFCGFVMVLRSSVYTAYTLFTGTKFTCLFRVQSKFTGLFRVFDGSALGYGGCYIPVPVLANQRVQQLGVA